MRGLAKVTIIGNLGADPEMRYTPEGKPVTSFRVAVGMGRSKDGVDLPPLWVSVSAWEKLGELANQYLRKGSAVYVEGRPKVRAYLDKAGEPKASFEVTATDVRFLSSKAQGSGQEEAGRDETSPEGASRGDGDTVPF